MSLNLKRSWLPGLLAVAVGLTLAWQSQAFDDEAATAPAAEKKADAADAIAVPDGTPEELLKFIDKLNSTRPTGATRDELVDNYKKTQNAVLAASKKVLDSKPTDKQAAAAIRAQLKAYGELKKVGDDSAAEKATELVNRLKDDNRPEVQEIIADQLLALRQEEVMKDIVKLIQTRNVDEKETPKLLDEWKDILSKQQPDAQALQLTSYALMFTGMSNPEIAEKYYREFGELFTKSDDKQLKQRGESFIGAARRMGLMGKPIEISGTTLDGKKFDISSYKGKVVLIDFWATWCGPCIAEIPNVRKNYEAYHDKGFEVVGVSLDKLADEEKVKQFVDNRSIPWLTLFSTDEEASGFETPSASYYGIMAIPTVILVNQEGNVVSLNARGPELGKQLEKLLGAPEKTTDEKTGDKSAAASEKDAL